MQDMEAADLSLSDDPIDVSEAERELHSRVLYRALKDVINGVNPRHREKAKTGYRPSVEALRAAESALGWIFDDCDANNGKQVCGREPCVIKGKEGRYLCQGWELGKYCGKVTFREACRRQDPPLDPHHVRSNLIHTIKGLA
jgi:hypothetical protein